MYVLLQVATLFIPTLLLYCLTLAPSITFSHFGGDGAELAAAAHTLGIAHPSGYPTYLVIAKVFTLMVPWGEHALKLNFLSAIFGSSTVVLVYNIGRLATTKTFLAHRIGGNYYSVSAYLGAMCLAVTPIFWSQSIITEVHTLNTFFLALITFLLLRWNATKGEPSYLLPLSSLALGIGLGNHMTLLLLIPPMAYCIFSNRRRVSSQTAILSTISFLLGLSIYIYLPISASQTPPISWGDPIDLQGFFWTVSGTPYRELVFGVPLADIPLRAIHWASLLVSQFNLIGFSIGILGLWRLSLQNVHMALFTSLIFSSYWIYSLTYNTNDSHIYLLPALMSVSIWIGVGISWIGNLLLMGLSRYSYSNKVMPMLITVFVFAAIPTINLLSNYSAMNLSGNTEALQYAREIIESVETDAIILADSDQELFPIWYYVHVLKNDPKPTILSTRLMQFDWYIRQKQRLIPNIVPLSTSTDKDYRSVATQIVLHNLGSRPIYATRGAEFLLEPFDVDIGERLLRILGYP